MTPANALAPARLVPLAVLAASVGALALAYTAETVFGLEPCILCLYQRIPYAVTGVLALLALGVPADSRVRAASVGLAAAVFAVGAGLAFYHVGVEQHWWASPACQGKLATGLTLADLKAALTRRPPKACDDVDWRLFGISLAGYNLMASAALAVAAGCGARRLMKEHSA